MGDYTERKEVAYRTVYQLPNPTNWAEVSKVFAAIRQDFPNNDCDDSVIVESNGEEILFVVAQTGWAQATEAFPVTIHNTYNGQRD